MISTVNIKSMEMSNTVKSAGTNSADESKTEGSGFQDLIDKVSSVNQEENQEKPVIKQDCDQEEKQGKTEKKELQLGEVIPLMDLLSDRPVTLEHLQEIISDVPVISAEIPEISSLEDTSSLAREVIKTDLGTMAEALPETLPETVHVNFKADIVQMDKKSVVPQIVETQNELAQTESTQAQLIQETQAQTVVNAVPMNETPAVIQMALQGEPKQTEPRNLNAIEQFDQVMKGIAVETVKTSSTDTTLSTSKTGIQSQASVLKPQISTAETQIPAQKAENVENLQIPVDSVDKQQGKEKAIVDIPVIEETQPKLVETEKSSVPGKTEEREVDLSNVFQQEKTGASSFQEDIIKIKLAEPFNRLNAENVKNIADKITENIHAGKREFQIQMNPENLGKIQVKISMLDTGIKVTLSCESQKTYQLLAERASGINQIVEQNTGSQSVVEIKEGYWNQQKDATDQHSRQQQQENQQQEKVSKDETNDFIQQMRLGFFDKGLVV